MLVELRINDKFLLGRKVSNLAIIPRMGETLILMDEEGKENSYVVQDVAWEWRSLKDEDQDFTDDKVIIKVI